MGVYYYVVIPKLKILILAGRNIHEDMLEEEEKVMREFLSLWWDYNYEGNLPELTQIKEKKLKELKVEDIVSIAFYTSKIENFICLQNSPCTILKYMIAKRIDKNSYVISDVSEDINRLKRKKYKIVDEDEM